MSAQLDLEAESSEKLTTPQLQSLLRERHPRDRWALFFDVPDAVSLDARRRIDAVAVGIWKSVGRDVHGFELKVSRADWLRELRQVDKADPFVRICDYFWLVTADNKLARIEEIPACWGWLSATKAGLRIQRPASRLPETPLPHEFLVGLLRKLQGSIAEDPDVRALIEEQSKLARDSAAAMSRHRIQFAERDLAELKSKVERFEAQSGVSLTDWSMGNVGKTVRAMQSVNETHHGGVRGLLESQRQQLQTILTAINAALQDPQA